MSFPRAQNKRFNEDVGCGPGVGSYNPKFGGIDGAGSLLKGDRFRKEFRTPASLQKPAKTRPSNIRDVLHSSKKQLNFFESSESLGKLPGQENLNLKQELRRMKAQLEKEIQNKDSALIDLANEKIKVHDLKIKVEAITVSNNFQSEALEKKSEIVQSLKTSIQTLSAELRAKEDRITNLDTQRIQLEITNSKRSYELDNVKSDLCNLASEIENLQRDLNERDLLVQELKNKGLELQNQLFFLKSLESKLTSSITSLRGMEEELQAKDKRISNLQSSLQRTTSIFQESLSHAASMDNKCQLLENRFLDCTASLELLKFELANKNAQVEAAMASLHDLKESEMTLQLKSIQLQDQLQAKESLEADFNRKLQQTASDLSQQQDILNSWKSKYESLEATFSPFKENSRLRARVPVTKQEVPNKQDCLVRQSGKKAPLKSSENTAFF